MACLELSAGMRALLEELRDWPAVDVDVLRARPEWDQARDWGWIMESGELTGSGWRHAGDLPGGIILE